MKIEYLREFVVLSELLNFSLAAERLYLTQSGLSRHIALLEQYLGVQLLYRNTQSVFLTTAGLYFLERIKPLLKEFDCLRENMLLQTRSADSVFRIGLPQFGLNDYLGPVPALFRAKYPDVEIACFSGDPDQNIDALLRDAVDVILISHTPFANAEYLAFHDLFLEPLIAIMSDRHPLAGCAEIPLSKLAEETFFIVDSDYYHSLWRNVRKCCLQSGFEPKGPVKCSQLESVMIALRNNGGVTVLGNHLRRLASCGLTGVRLSGKECMRQQSFAYKIGNTNPFIPTFLQLFDAVGGGAWIMGASQSA
ncbi:MAG: LysR family transcriptional regulator [Clostridiales Family XIII bacterium]|nr:LysR family transcriptional regulator [Clostridiales Family XIII bacterium]